MRGVLVQGAEWNVWTNGGGSDRTWGELRKAVEAVKIVSGDSGTWNVYCGNMY